MMIFYVAVFLGFFHELILAETNLTLTVHRTYRDISEPACSTRLSGQIKAALCFFALPTQHYILTCVTVSCCENSDSND